MPSKIDSLVSRIADLQLRSELQAAVADLRKVTDFGLVYESHLPETVRLPQHIVRRGIKVVRRDAQDETMYEVVSMANGKATIRQVTHPDGSALSPEEADATAEQKIPTESLIVIAEFGEPIYPGLRHLESLSHGASDLSHVVINGENHHVLEALQFTHAGKVDCIYIDPPYNTGARDWKYNNRYVDDNDGYRHSRWLAFMEHRLRLAKELLNPERSVLIVTIDAREQARLGLLLEQTYPGCPIQMAAIVINPSGAGNDGLNRVDEYAFFVSVGTLNIPASRDDFLTDEDAPNSRIKGGLSWESFLRSGTNWYRSERPNLCYPIAINADTMHIVGAGAPYKGAEAKRPKTVGGSFAAWPVRKDGRLGIWRTDAETLMDLVQKGYAYVSSFDIKRNTYAIKYLLSGTIDLIESGEAPVEKNGHRGQVVAATTSTIDKIAKSVWYRPAHNAGKHGSDLLQTLIPGRHFPYPKSLYAVEDCLRICVGDKKDAVVLDFFAGSGTTAHAVARLNHQDGGWRQSISVTNNEVSEAEAQALRQIGHEPGDAAWEELGIFERIAKPRITAAITGINSEGAPLEGEYRFVDEFPMAEGFDENVTFFELIYLDAAQVEVDRAFAGIAPLLWLRAGGRGPIIAECFDGSGRRKPYAWTDRYGVLFNTDRWRRFVSKLPDTATTAYVVTDSQTEFSHIAGELPGHLDVVRLYERYLTTFAVNGNR